MWDRPVGGPPLARKPREGGHDLALCGLLELLQGKCLRLEVVLGCVSGNRNRKNSNVRWRPRGK